MAWKFRDSAGTSLIVCFALWLATEGLRCGYPGHPANGRPHVVQNEYAEGQKVNFVCNAGYVLLGSPSRTCLPNGTWAGLLPICDVGLSRLRTPIASGYLGQYPPQMATDGRKQTCFLSRQVGPRWWRVDLGGTFHVTSVVITFSAANFPQHFTVFVISLDGNSAHYKRCATFNGRLASQTANMMCAEGEGITGQLVHITDEREVIDYFALCEVDIFILREKYECGEPERPPQSYTVRYGMGVMEYKCVAGYKLKGTYNRQCLPSGQWSHSQPICQEVNCPMLLELDLGKVWQTGLNEKRKPIVGSQAMFSCEEGYILQGNSSRVCQEDGSWSGTDPMCQPVNCGKLKMSTPGGVYTLLNASTVYPSIAELQCKEEYTLEAEEQPVLIKCREDGRWSTPEASCVVKGMPVLDVGADAAMKHTENVVNGLSVGLIAGMAALGVLAILLVISLLIFRRKRRQNKHGDQHPLGQPASMASSSRKGSIRSSVAEVGTNGSLYQNEAFYAELPMGNKSGGGSIYSHGSRKGVSVSKEDIYEELGGRAGMVCVRPQAGGLNDGRTLERPRRGELVDPSIMALYAKVDFSKKRQSRVGRHKGAAPSQQDSAVTISTSSGELDIVPIKLRELPPIPKDDEENGCYGAAGSSNGNTNHRKTKPRNGHHSGKTRTSQSQHPFVLLDNAIYVGHPMVARDQEGRMVDNELYSFR